MHFAHVSFPFGRTLYTSRSYLTDLISNVTMSQWFTDKLRRCDVHPLLIIQHCMINQFSILKKTAIF